MALWENTKRVGKEGWASRMRAPTPRPLCLLARLGHQGERQTSVTVPVVTIALNPKLECSDQGFLSSCW